MKKLQNILIFLGLFVLLIAACAPFEQQITFVPVTYTPDVNAIVAQTFAAMTAQAIVTQTPTTNAVTSTATLTPTITATATPVPGSISGTLSYPSEFIPPLRVVAFNANGFNYRYVDTMLNQGAFQITGLAPGTYHVVAYVIDGTLAGGYTQAVPCGLAFECADHTLLDVIVISGKDTPDILPADWYAPEGFFPPMPLQ